MNKWNDSDWKRLEEVIAATGHTVNSFARQIGLPRGENLYRIKRGNNGISRDVAERIHAQFPQYSVGWLMFGESVWPQLTRDDDKIVRLPMYHDYSTLDFPLTGKPDDYLVLSASVARGAEIAVAYSDDVVNPYLRGAYLLLIKHRAADPSYLQTNSIIVIISVDFIATVSTLPHSLPNTSTCFRVAVYHQNDVCQSSAMGARY